VARDADWLRAELGRWARVLEGCRVSTTGGWRFEADGALACAVEIADDINVTLGPWSRTFAFVDADAAADLVAAALFGRIEAEVGRVGDRWVRFRLYLGRGEIADVRRIHLAFWKRAAVTKLRNAFDPPRGVVLREGGALPYAPWVGILGEDADGAEPAELPVDGEIDLHPFSPREVKGVVEAYIDECLRRGIHELRIVHGKGIGNLRRTVHALLDKHPAVARYRLGGSGGGSWGATVVDLKPRQRR
jgi:hypothetical protein